MLNECLILSEKSDKYGNYVNTGLPKGYLILSEKSDNLDISFLTNVSKQCRVADTQTL